VRENRVHGSMGPAGNGAWATTPAGYPTKGLGLGEEQGETRPAGCVAQTLRPPGHGTPPVTVEWTSLFSSEVVKR
jgi:hypothetical protein